MTVEFSISTLIPASPQEVYRAWVSSDGHTAMTGSSATVSAEVGEEFEAWDGYIHGGTLCSSHRSGLYKPGGQVSLVSTGRFA
jgi:hypothetical protein